MTSWGLLAPPVDLKKRLSPHPCGPDAIFDYKWAWSIFNLIKFNIFLRITLNDRCNKVLVSYRILSKYNVDSTQIGESCEHLL